MPTANNVTVGKPKIGGAVYRAPLGSTLPTNATSTLNGAFVELGYVSEDGLVNSNSPESDVIRAWGGDIVYTVTEGREDTFAFTLIESMKADVLKAVYGDSKVSGTMAAGMSVQVTAEELPDAAWVFDMVLRNGALKRIVIPDGKISEVGDISYTDSDVTGYELTLTCMADSSGVSHYEYLHDATTGTTGTT